MAIIETLDLGDFMCRFEQMERDYFSREGYEFLYDYYDQLSEDTGEPFEMDVIAICGEWSEFDDLDALLSDYPNYEPDEDEDDEGEADEETADEDEREALREERREELALKALEQATQVVKLKNGHFLVMAF